MTRELTTRKTTFRDITIDGVEPEPAAWLEAQARQHESLTFSRLLAHADDGVIWGVTREGTLQLSSRVAPEVSPPLRAKTLQDARLFSEDAELLLWRDGSSWRARLIEDDIDGQEIASFDEPQVLWGTEGTAIGDSGFVLMRDGAQGLCHAVPLAEAAIPPGRNRPLRLQMRHYVESDPKTGTVRVTTSRLTGLVREGSPL